MKELFKNWITSKYAMAQCSYSGNNKTMYVKGIEDNSDKIVDQYIEQEVKIMDVPFKIVLQ